MIDFIWEAGWLVLVGLTVAGAMSALGAIGWAIYWSWPAPKPKRKRTEVFTWWPEGHVHIKRGKQ